MLRIEHFDSVAGLLTYLDTTRHGKGWKRYDLEYLSTLDSVEFTMQCGTLNDNIARARTLDGLQDDIALLDRLVDQLAATVPAPASIKRVPTWGRTGNHVSIHRVLSGNLKQAWRRTERQVRPTHGQVLTLLLSAAFSADCSPAQIRLTSAATLAYAALAEQAGYRVDLWAVQAMGSIYNNRSDDLVAAVCLKRAQDPWCVQNVAVAMLPGWLRKLIFRVAEAGVGKGYGALWRAYGYALQGAEAHKLIEPWTCQYNLGAWQLGAEETDAITSETQAAQWIQHQLAGLAA